MIRVCPLKDRVCSNGMNCNEPCAHDQYYDPNAKPSQDAHETARLPNTSSNPDLGELVARLREHQWWRWVTVGTWTPDDAPQRAADALERLKIDEQLALTDVAALRDLYALANSAGGEWKAKAEALEKERDGLKVERDLLTEAVHHAHAKVTSVCAQRNAAEAEVAGLKQALEPFAMAAEHCRDVPLVSTHDNVWIWQTPGLIDRMKVTYGDFRRAAELHAAVSGDQK